MLAAFKKSDGSYLDNSQSWVKSLVKTPEEFLARIVLKRGGSASDYVVADVEKPWLKCVVEGVPVPDVEKSQRAQEVKEARDKRAAIDARVQGFVLQAALALAQKAGETDVVNRIQERLGG